MKRAAVLLASSSLLSWVTLFISPSSLANDSIGSVATGGITFLKSEEIRLVSEYLHIAPNAIRIRYKFLNESDKNINATIAFPMPPYGWNPGWYEGTLNERPLENFSVQVNGRVMDTRLDKRAMVGNTDVTDKLREIGLTEEQIFKTFATCANEDEQTSYYCGISKEQEGKLEKVGDWKVAETALWEQSFPAHQEIEVRHEYSPFVGQYYIYTYQQGSFDYEQLEHTSDACLDSGTISALKNRVQALVNRGAKVVRINVAKVEYILGTGRNWKGPINDFNLKIEKDSSEQIVSLCFPGKPKRTSPTTLEFKQKNYVPQDTVVVYYFAVSQVI